MGVTRMAHPTPLRGCCGETMTGYSALTAAPRPAEWKFSYTHHRDGKAAWMVKKDARAFSGPNVLDLKAAGAEPLVQRGNGTHTMQTRKKAVA